MLVFQNKTNSKPTHPILNLIDVTVFEANPGRTGGRTFTTNFAGLDVDVGGTAISTLNEYLVGFIDKFNITRSDGESTSASANVWDDYLNCDGENIENCDLTLGKDKDKMGIFNGETFEFIANEEGLSLPM